MSQRPPISPNAGPYQSPPSTQPTQQRPPIQSPNAGPYQSPPRPVVSQQQQAFTGQRSVYGNVGDQISFGSVNGVIVSSDFWGAPVIQAPDGTLSCPGFTGPTYSDRVWDYIVFGPGLKTPGICEISIEKKRDHQKKKSAGTDGARVTFHGMTCGEIDIKITLWTPEQFRQIGILWELLFPHNASSPPNKSSKPVFPPAFPVSHPLFAKHKINAVQFVHGNGPIRGNPERARIFEMKAVEFLPPGNKNTTSTAKAVQTVTSVLDPKTHPAPGNNPANTSPRK